MSHKVRIDGIIREVKSVAGSTLPTLFTISNPPSGKHKIINFYVDENKKVVILYDDQPVA